MVETFCGFKTAILALHDCILDKFKAKFDLIAELLTLLYTNFIHLQENFAKIQRTSL